MKRMADLLVNNGINVNAHLHMRRPGKEFLSLYVLSPGTPLPWAEAASNATAVALLIEWDADYSIRDKVNPYTYDMNLRYLLLNDINGPYIAPTP